MWLGFVIGSAIAEPFLNAALEARAELETGGHWQIRLRMSALEEKVTSVVLLRSTSDLDSTRTPTRYPIAVFALTEGQREFTDLEPPEGVPLFYQWEVTTPSGTFHSPSVSVTAPYRSKRASWTKPVRVEIDKSKFVLTLFDAQGPVRRLPIALGANPVHRKLIAEMADTPEGDYHLLGCRREGKEATIEIDYPNQVDQARYSFFKDSGLLPYPTPEIGQGFEIHGGGIASNWTWGTIAMRDEDIEWLISCPEFKAGTPIRILGAELKAEDLDLESQLDSTKLLQLKGVLRSLGYLTDVGQVSWILALSRFQNDKSLPISGVLDQWTYARLMALLLGDFGLR